MSRKIRYIGKCPTKRDNIAKSKSVWPHPGAVVEVPDDVAVRLIPHHTSFVEAGAENDPGKDNDISYEVIPGTNERYFVNAAGERVDTPEDVLDVQVVKPSGTTFSFSNDKDEAIKQAIQMIDCDDTDNLTTNGYPRVELIENILGYPCPAPDRDRVWEQMEADEPVGLADANGEVIPPAIVV